MTEPRTSTRGFGYQPERSAGYFFEVRQGADGDIAVFERFAATAGSESERLAVRERARLNARRWNLVEGTVASEFNHRLQQARLRPGRWLKAATPLAPHFGKELVLLIWAIEDQEPTVIPRMLANWRGLAPEERWWFYTTINASARSAVANHAYGWRAAIKIAFLDEPRDIGLEALRIAAVSEQPLEQAPARTRKRTYDASAPAPDKDVPTQGRLFAEPDRPEYDV
jgi:hypothetical protein